jgi:hypothetical protein
MPSPNVTSYEHFTDEDRGYVTVEQDTLYQHKTLQLDYTTYDMREDNDRIYQRHHPDIMVLSNDANHPHLYGRILDLFHVRVRNNGPNTLLASNATATLEMAWVRWFTLDEPQGPQGFNSLRYPSVSFCKSDEQDAFGFIHPDEILRAVHLIPDFKFGHTTEYLDGPSMGRPKDKTDDWKHFRVNMYGMEPSTIVPLLSHSFRLADRDMFMRFRGGGIGHMYMRHIEPGLNTTGWGSTWPSIQDKYPEPEEISTAPNHSHANNGGTEGGDGDGCEDVNTDASDDGEGQDPEQLDEVEDDDELDVVQAFDRCTGKTNIRVDEEDNNSSEGEAEGDGL